MSRFWFVLSIYLVNAALAQEWFPVLLTLPLFALVAFNLVRIKSVYANRYDMFWFCIFLYFVIAPCQMIHDGMIGGDPPVTMYTYSKGEFITAMAIVVIFAGAFSLFRPKNTIETPNTGRTVIPFFTPWFLTMVSVLSFALYTGLSGGLANVLASRSEKIKTEISLVTPLPLAAELISTLMLIALLRDRNKWNLSRLPCLAIALPLMAISSNPFNTARFVLLATWVPIGLALLKGRLRAVFFYSGCLFALIVVFPILSITTRVGLDGLSTRENIVSLNKIFQLPFIDVFDTLTHCVRFMSYTDYFLGDKLMAIVLFFVPRTVWEYKPIVGGLDIGNELLAVRMAGTSNLSMFIGGDLYMDFSFAGVLIGGLLIGYWFSNLKGDRFGSLNGHNLFEYVLLASIPILVRGPVGAVLPLFLCQVGFVWLLTVVLKRSTAPHGGRVVIRIPDTAGEAAR